MPNFISSAGDQARGSDSGYTYRQGESEDQFINQNAFSPQSGYGLANFAEPTGSFYRAINGKSFYNQQRKKFEAQQDLADNQNRARQLASYQDYLQGIQGQQDAARGQALSSLSDAYGNGQRQQAREQQYNAQLTNSLAGLGQQYQLGSRSAGLQMAQQGLRGGSTDIESQAGLRNTYDTGALGAQQSALDRLNALNQADVQQYQNLRYGLMTGNPQTEQQYAQMAANNVQSAQNAYQMADFNRTGAQLRGQQMDNTSRFVGNLGYAGANAADQYYTNQGVNQYGNGNYQQATQMGYAQPYQQPYGNYGYGDVQGPPSPQYNDSGSTYYSNSDNQGTFV